MKFCTSTKLFLTHLRTCRCPDQSGNVAVELMMSYIGTAVVPLVRLNFVKVMHYLIVFGGFSAVTLSFAPLVAQINLAVYTS